MLAIIPDYEDDEVLSDSSENTDISSPQETVGIPRDCKEETINTSALIDLKEYFPASSCGKSEPTLSPRVTAELPSNNRSSISANVSPVESAMSRDSYQLTKFLTLQNERLLAAQEMVEEGYRCKRRRRKRKNTEEVNSPGKHPHHSRQNVPEGDVPAGKSSQPVQAPSAHNECWETLKGYLDVNSHISQGVDHGKYAPKSGLEKRLDQAVAEGNFERAESISDQLATRELGCKIAKAADARDYVKWKTEQEEEKGAKRKNRKKKLAWGFQTKNRWEMKANM